MTDDTSRKELIEWLDAEFGQVAHDRLRYSYINNIKKDWEKWPSRGLLDSASIEGTRWEWRRSLIDIGGGG